MKSGFSLILLLLFFVCSGNAQSSLPVKDHHDHYQNEIGVANTAVYFLTDEELAYGLRVHYITRIEETKFGIGFGYKRIFDEQKHNTIGVIGSYRPIDPFSINLSPGITFEDRESKQMDFALHIETIYEFEINDFHIDPALEIAFDPQEVYLSFGIHIGYGF
ncbi:MAG: hypothetical protein ACEPOZ_07415 [Marinifilaceae bacterium]